MRQTNCKIGFNDVPLMLFTIPALSFIVPFVFMGCRLDREPFFGWHNFFTCLFVTIPLWLGDRLIMIWSRTKYPLFKDVRKRLFHQSVSMLLFTIIGNNLIGWIMDDFVFIANKGSHFKTDILIKSNSAAIFCTIMIIAIYESIYFMNELKKSVEEKETLKRESLKAQLNALKTQVNPHFLFNNLNTLTAIIPDTPDQAIEFVQQMSKVYRHILEVQDEKTIPLHDELDVLKAYGFLLKTRFGDNLDIDIDVPAEKLQQKIVPLSLQLLMENAIKHNIVSSAKPLKIKVFAENGHLLVSNNLQVKNQMIESTGIGLDNIRNRYKLLSNDEVMVNANGESFTVSIPLISN
ncbi:MAG: histidine kinase [Ferruginibacter sp.]|nr:histidine kinase [Ferruginibacter sp.]